MSSYYQDMGNPGILNRPRKELNPYTEHLFIFVLITQKNIVN